LLGLDDFYTERISTVYRKKKKSSLRGGKGGWQCRFRGKKSRVLSGSLVDLGKGGERRRENCTTITRSRLKGRLLMRKEPPSSQREKISKKKSFDSEEKGGITKNKNINPDQRMRKEKRELYQKNKE